ncbi:MAG: NAD-binding protein [Thermodesulfobacteriota bacterium]|jgi:trk system potassium uptake protein TrkA
MYIIIVGGGKVGYQLTKLLLSQGHEVMLIEKDRNKFASLVDELGDSILYGDGSTMETLTEAGANRAEAIVAVTGHDEDNLVICQLSKMMFFGPRTIARVNNPRNEETFWGLGIDATVSATRLINALIQEQVKAHDMLIPLLTIRGGDVEIVQTSLSPSSPVVNKKIKDLVLPKGTLFISINRGEEVIIPRGDTDLREDDQVLVLVRKAHEAVLRQILMAPATDRKHA